MIIVSQDEDIIVNFDNVEVIDVVADLDGTGEIPFKIYWETSSSRGELGKYKTEERAKEVLQEIITRYKNWENIKVGQPSGICSPVYEMPKE